MDDEWKFTRHAAERALDMAVDPEDIYAVLVAPKTTWSVRDGLTAMTDYRISVVVDGQQVVTVVWYRLPRGPRFGRTLEEDLKRIRDRSP